MEMMKNSKAIAMVTTALLVASLFWLVNTKRVSASLETGLQKERLKSEELLSQKLLLEKEMQRAKDRLGSMQGKNSDLDRLLQTTADKLKVQELEFNRLKRENASVAKIKKQRQELIELQAGLENELQILKSSYVRLEAENKELFGSIVALQERNDMLTSELNQKVFASLDYSQLEAVKGKKEKLTVNAKRTRKLIAHFDVPGHLKNLSFRILDANGNPLTAKDGMVASSITLSEKNYTASASSGVQVQALQNVEMTYVPRQKLRSGIYTVEILNDNLYLASLKVKLN
jgi:myosin heavy subunit